MTAELHLDPLVGAPPVQIPLADAPLVRVLAQVRFSEVLGVESPEMVAGFQDAIAHSYGVLNREAAVAPNNFIFNQPPVTHWRFADHPLDWTWRVTLTTQFVTLETTKYTNREEFFERLEVVLEAVEAHIRPAMKLRLGVRYVNRLVGIDTDSASLLLKPEMLGMAGAGIKTVAHAAISETVFQLGSATLVVKFASLPPNAVIDPTVTSPVIDRSIVLDLDIGDDGASQFKSHEIAKAGVQLAERSYTFFRWAVTDEFIRRYGGKL